MRIITALGVLLALTGCAQTAGLDHDDRNYQRMDYFEAVFLPASKACQRAGGFMIFEETAGNNGSHRPTGLSYTDMRTAVARGCAGI